MSSTINMSELYNTINTINQTTNSQPTIINSQNDIPTFNNTNSANTLSNSPQKIKKLKVIIGLSGNHFSQTFLMAWTNSINMLIRSDHYEIKISPSKNSSIPTRMHTLGLDVLRGKAQKAFHNESYDVFVSIDSDIVFSPIQLIELIECTKIHHVVSGFYMMQDNTNFAVVKEWNKSYFIEHGTFQSLQIKDIESDLNKFKTELDARKKAAEEQRDPGALSNPNFMKVSYVAMGFFACRKEVLDSLVYPFFNRELQRMRDKNGLELVDMCSEDVAFCKNIEDAGFDIMLNTRLHVGHESRIIF